MSDIIIYEGAQGSPEWLALRAGIPTASCFATVMASGRGGGESVTRAKYMREMAGEIITGEPNEAWEGNKHTAHGHAIEPETLAWYSFANDAVLKPVSFIRNGRMGCSPDSLVGDNGMVEAKRKIPHLQIQVLMAGALPPEHKAQVQGQIMVAEREWCDFVSYWPKLPPFCIRVYRDEPYIATMRYEIKRFNEELDALVTKIRAM